MDSDCHLWASWKANHGHWKKIVSTVRESLVLEIDRRQNRRSRLSLRIRGNTRRKVIREWNSARECEKDARGRQVAMNSSSVSIFLYSARVS